MLAAHVGGVQEETMFMSEQLRLEKGTFGPFKAPLHIDVRPLTIFVGPQGSGKSLLSEILYFFRDAENLLYRMRGTRDVDATVAVTLRHLRAGEKTQRALSVFLAQATTTWTYIGEHERSVSMYVNNRARPLGKFQKEIERWIALWRDNPAEPPSRALFIPAERLFLSRFINTDPQLLGHSALPITVREFGRHLLRVNDWYPFRSEEAQRIQAWAAEALRGYFALERKGRYANTWQWRPRNAEATRLDIELASSGQMQSWPLIVVAQMLVEWQKALDTVSQAPPSSIHIEEPESHLYPEAQMAIAWTLAFLVNRGFSITITTHSADLLFAFNNLLAAGVLLPDSVDDATLPPPETRLKPEQVAVYKTENGSVTSIVSPLTDAKGQRMYWIEEDVLRQAQHEQDIQLSRILTYASAHSGEGKK